MNKMAICVPTYNQPDMIREMLIRCLDIYDTFGIHMYIFDSSQGQETETIILQYAAEGKNIFYRRYPSGTHSNLKVLEAYREITGMGEYEYLWLCPDYIQLTREGARCVMEHCQEGFDICVLNYRDVEHTGERTYTDSNAFFLDCAWHMSSYMATVIRTPAFADMEWEPFYERYTVPGRICHSHVALYFEQLAEMAEIKAVHVPVSSMHMRVSPYRGASLWKRDVFPIWCEYWPDMIRALPDSYRHKDEVIKKLGVNTGIFGWDNFVRLRREGIYDRHVYHKYRGEWKQLTDVPPGLLRVLSVMPARMAGVLGRPAPERRILKRKLRLFCRKHTDIFIYGCGFMAKKTSVLLDALHVNYRGYVVSDLSGEKRSFHGLPVTECGKLRGKGSDTGIILALNKENTVQLMREKEELGSYHIFFMYPYEDVLE